MGKKYNELAAILDKMSRKDAYKAAEWIYDNYHILINPSKIVLTDKMKEIIDEIFKLAPYANCIPITYENVCGDEWWTYVDMKNISYLEEYLTPMFDEDDYDEDEYEEGEWVMPYFSDDTTKGNWKKIQELWEKLLSLIGLMEGFEEGDYCEFDHISTTVITKDYKIQHLDGINR